VVEGRRDCPFFVVLIFLGRHLVMTALGCPHGNLSELLKGSELLP
jgi:hypothetical protein